MNQKGNILVLVFGGVAVLALALAGYFYLQIPKGESVNVGNYTKTIPDSKPVDPTANPDSIGVNWKTYTNTVSNYSVKYPTIWQIKDISKDPDNFVAPNVETLVILGPVDSTLKAGTEAISIFAETGTYEHVLELDRGYPGGINVDRKESNIKIDGLPAIRITGRVVLAKEMAGEFVDEKRIRVIINKSGKPISISTTPEFEKTLDQILSTFKFLGVANDTITSRPNVQILFDPESFFDSAIKRKLMDRIINPYLDYSYGDKSSQNYGVVITLSQNIRPDSMSEYPYSLNAKYVDGGTFGVAIDKNISWFQPECMGSCNFSETFKGKYPEIVKLYGAK